jgi:hypothetical protein
VRLALIMALYLFAAGAYADAHADRLAEIAIAYRSDVAQCRALFAPGQRLDECLKDARLARRQAQDGEAIAERGRKLLDAKCAQIGYPLAKP